MIGQKFITVKVANKLFFPQTFPNFVIVNSCEMDPGEWIHSITRVDVLYFCFFEYKFEVLFQGWFIAVTPLQAQRWHIGNEPFGRQWQSGDVVGCMIDLTEMNIMFTLNGEMLISDSGSEMAFKDIEIGEGKS